MVLAFTTMAWATRCGDQLHGLAPELLLPEAMA